MEEYFFNRYNMKLSDALRETALTLFQQLIFTEGFSEYKQVHIVTIYCAVAVLLCVGTTNSCLTG